MSTTRKNPATSSPRASRSNEEILRAVIDALPVGVVVWQAGASVLFANQRATDIAGRPFEPGLTAAELVTSLHIVVAGTDDPYPADRLPPQDTDAGASSRFADAEFIRPDGTRRAIEGWKAPMRGADSTSRLALTAFADITERRRDEVLRAGEARVLEAVAAGEPLELALETLTLVFEAQADGMIASILLLEDGERVRHGAGPHLPGEWVLAVDGEPIGPEAGSCGTAMYFKQMVIVADIATDPRWARYRDTALRAGLRACWSVPIMGSNDEALGSFALYHTEPREPTPRLIQLATQASHIAAIAIQHHRSQGALLESEARARLIVEAALDANIVMDSDGVITSWNTRAAVMFGWTADEAVGQRLSGLIIPEPLRAQHERGLRHYATTGEAPILNRRLEVTALHRDGREFPVQLAVTPIRRNDRVLFSAFIEDISASRRAEQALRDSERHLSLVYDHVDDVLFQLQVEPEGFRFVSVNPAFTAATGLAIEQVRGKLVQEVIPEPSAVMAIAHYREAVQARRTVRWEETSKYPAGVRHGDVSVTPVFDEQGQPRFLIGSVRDMTAHRHMEEEVRQLQKLEAIGRLSGGIAHDFNNILGVIVGVGNMLVRDLEDADQRGQAEEIVRAGERGANLTRQFLAFGRKQVLQPVVLDLSDAVRNLETMLRRLIRADIHLAIELAHDLWRVKADAGQIEQVVVNLVVNARDAMPDGGTLAVETANAELDAEFAETHFGTAPGSYVLLEVSDTGHGMSDATKRRLFEPFFTTKDVGKGTGLGLATVYGIVKQSGGHIWVWSEEGRGARFRIYLPRSTEGVAAAPDRGERRVSGGRGLAGVHVLLVEDEPALRKAIARMLERLQCRLSVAANGDEALALVASQQLTPDVLITDMVMPGMSGTELAERLRTMLPSMKVLRMSGYADKDMSQPGTLEPGEQFLQKPFTMNALAGSVQRALEQQPD